MMKKRLATGVGCVMAIGAAVPLAHATVVSGSMGGYIYSQQLGTYDPISNPSAITYQLPTTPNTPASASFTYDTSTAIPTGGGHYQVVGSLTFGSLMSTGITSLDIEVRDSFFDSVNISWNDLSGATSRSLYFSVVVVTFPPETSPPGVLQSRLDQEDTGDGNLSNDDVLERLSWLMATRGVPEHVRSDNGAEFAATAVREWLNKVGVKTLFIEPGSPWENGYVESFNGKLRDELLNGEIFYTLKEAKVLIEQWRKHYNTIRPHSSLGYRDLTLRAPRHPAAVATPSPHPGARSFREYFEQLPSLTNRDPSWQLIWKQDSGHFQSNWARPVWRT